MSGLVRTYSAWSRAQSRSSRVLSPSWVDDPDVEPERPQRRPTGRGPAPWSARGRARWRPAGPARPARRRPPSAPGSWKASDLPEAVPVETTTCRPARAVLGSLHLVAPRRGRRRARRTPRAAPSGVHAGQRRPSASRGGSSSRWVSRSARPRAGVRRSSSPVAHESRWAVRRGHAGSVAGPAGSAAVDKVGTTAPRRASACFDRCRSDGATAVAEAVRAPDSGSWGEHTWT